METSADGDRGKTSDVDAPEDAVASFPHTVDNDVQDDVDDPANSRPTALPDAGSTTKAAKADTHAEHDEPERESSSGTVTTGLTDP